MLFNKKPSRFQMGLLLSLVFDLMQIVAGLIDQA
jgi:hypothetical protein